MFGNNSNQKPDHYQRQKTCLVLKLTELGSHQAWFAAKSTPFADDFPDFPRHLHG
jgi:hypothetical protein